MFEGDSADTCAVKISTHVYGGPSRGSRVRRPGSEDPHLRERKFGRLSFRNLLWHFPRDSFTGFICQEEMNLSRSRLFLKCTVNYGK